MRREFKSAHGDTIIEVLLSMAVLAVVAGSAYSVSTRSFHAAINSQDRDQAVSLAQQQLEIIKNADAVKTISTYEPVTSNQVFCIKSDSTVPATIPTGGCPASLVDSGASSNFTIADSYDKTAQRFSIKVNWTSADNRPQQTQVYYRPANSYVKCPDGTACTTTNAPQLTSLITPPPSAGVSVYVNGTTNPPQVTYNTKVDVTWSTTNVKTGTCSASSTPDVWSGAKGDNSTGNGDKTAGLTAKTTFTLTCTAYDGTSASASTTVDVSVPPLSVSFTADSYSLGYGQGTTLHWSATNGNKCQHAGGYWGASNANIGTSSSYWTGGLTSSESYYITCSGPGGSINKSVNINVAPPTYPGLQTLQPIVYGNQNVYFRSNIYPRGYPTTAWYQWGINSNLSGCQLTTSAFSEPGVNYWVGDTRFGSWWGNGTPVNYYNCDSWVFYYRVCAYNTSNYITTCGNIVRFGLLAPYVSTGGASHDSPPGVSNSSGWELYGSVNPNGNNIDSCYFQWDNDSDLNNGERNTSCSSLPGNGASYVGVTTHIDLDWYYRGEEDNRYFYYRLCAYTSVGLGTRCGSVQAFHTR